MMFTEVHNDMMEGNGFDLQLFSDDAGESEDLAVDDRSILSEAKSSFDEGYDIELPDGFELDQERYDSFAAMAKEIGLSNEHANKVARFGFGYIEEMAKALGGDFTGRSSGWKEEAVAELGHDYDKTVSLAAVGLEYLEKDIPNLRAALDETGAGNRIEVIRAVAAIGELVGEDNGLRLFGSASKGKKSMYDNTDFSKY